MNNGRGGGFAALFVVGVDTIDGVVETSGQLRLRVVKGRSASDAMGPSVSVLVNTRKHGQNRVTGRESAGNSRGLGQDFSGALANYGGRVTIGRRITGAGLASSVGGLPGPTSEKIAAARSHVDGRVVG